MSKNTISHEGIIQDVTDECIKVKILQTSACAVCKVHGHCSAAESKEKIIEVRNITTTTHQVGDKVVVVMGKDEGRDAIILAFIVPFVLMVGVLIITFYLSKNEALAALFGLGVLIPYYFLLYLFKDKITRKFAFRLEE
ncbi:MAG: SoxR reducing system RseC family protein [Prevotella sp.]|nr:SoxR reducing system RseC family protein [Prevotella sp.]